MWRLPWGKSEPARPLWCHLIDAGCIAQALLSPRCTFSPLSAKFAAATGCPSDLAQKWLPFLVALHDIGKCSPDFQAYLPENLTIVLREHGLNLVDPHPGFRHEALSQEWIAQYLGSMMAWHPKSASIAATAIEGHHGSFRHKEQLAEFPVFAATWNPVRFEMVDIIKMAFTVPAWSVIPPLISIRISLRICGQKLKAR